MKTETEAAKTVFYIIENNSKKLTGPRSAESEEQAVKDALVSIRDEFSGQGIVTYATDSKIEKIIMIDTIGLLSSRRLRMTY